MDWGWSIGWDRCITVLFFLAAGHGITTYLASRHTEDPEDRSEAWGRGVLAPLSLYSRAGRFYKWLSYGFAVAAIITLAVCYLSPNPFSGLAPAGFDLCLTLFLTFLGTGAVLNWVAIFRYREDSDQTHWTGWRWPWDPLPLAPRGERLRFIGTGLLGSGLLVMLLCVAVQ